MAKTRIYEATLDEDLKQALGESGYTTEGFTGTTLGEYSKWYKGLVGFDPLQTAFELQGGQGRAPIWGEEGQSAADFIRANPLDFDPSQGTFSVSATTEAGLLEQAESQKAWANRQEMVNQGRGEAMLSWLMGLGQELPADRFSQVAGVGMQSAQTSFGAQSPTLDLSGRFGFFQQQRMEEEFRRQQAEASGFDFTRDLLPGLLNLGTAGLYGAVGGDSGVDELTSRLDNVFGG